MIRYLLAALLCAVPVSAWAQFKVELGVGLSHADVRSNGTWYQQGFAHALHTDAPTLEVNAQWTVTPRTSLRLGVVNLGHVSSDSWDTPNDANYSGHAAHPCNGPCLPLAHYMGAGHVWGVQALAEHRWGDRWQFGILGGVILYRETWRMDVPDWYPSDPEGSRTWYTPRGVVGGYLIGPVVPIHARDQRWAAGLVGGIMLAKRGSPWALSLRYYKDGAKFGGHGGGWPPLWTGQLVAMVSYRA